MKKTNSQKEENRLWEMASQGKWNMVKSLLEEEKPLYISQMLLSQQENPQDHYHGTNLLWFITCWQQWDLIQALLQKDLITVPMLLSKPENPRYDGHGANVLWLMTGRQQWDLIQTLLQKDLITIPMLLSKPENPRHEDHGANVLWLMTGRQQWDLIQTLLQKDLITVPMLLSKPENPRHDDHGANVLWFMACRQQWDLIQALLQKDLITVPMLLSKPENPEDRGYGTSVLWYIASAKQWDLIRILQEKQLITTSMLLSRPERETFPGYGTHVLELLARDQQWELLDRLTPEINTELLLSKQNLESSNVLEQILHAKQSGIIKKLLTAPLSPLQETPWAWFTTAPLMLQLIKEGDTETAKKLIELGATPPDCSEVSATTAALLCEAKLQPRRLAANFGTGSIEIFDHKSQRTYWHGRALSMIQKQAALAGCLFAEYDGTRDPLPIFLKRLILEYALGEQEGVTYKFHNSLYLFKHEQIAQPQPKDEVDITEHLQQGLAIFKAPTP
jgi:ankyrin repeat protein